MKMVMEKLRSDTAKELQTSGIESVQDRIAAEKAAFLAVHTPRPVAPTPAAEPQTASTSSPTASAPATKEKAGTKIRKSELLGTALERRLKDLKEDVAAQIAEFEMKLDKVRTAAKEKEAKMEAEVATKTATAKRLSGVNETLHKEHNELVKRAVAAEAEVENLNHHIKTVIEDSSTMIADLKQQVQGRDERLTQALTPEAIEEVKSVFADAIYNMFAEVDNAEPGFITRMLANPNIEQESKKLVLEAFKVHGILLQ